MAARGVKAVSYSVVEKELRRPGRPRSFDREAALEQAMEMFWADGYEGVDMERIARAVGVTKPSLYHVFGDKAALFLKALHRYSQTHAASALAAFEAEPDITHAVRAFCETAVANLTIDGRAGCLLACTAAGPVGSTSGMRDFLTRGQAAVVERVTRRFARETKARRLSAAIPAKRRARLLVDLMQGLALRARVGASGTELLKDVRSYLPLLLG